jgi:anti-sigma factor ChrR (cupin superfamily)
VSLEPDGLLEPGAALAGRLAERIGGAGAPPPGTWDEPPWEEVAPGIRVKLLANDEQRKVVSMLVRLLPGASYPAHSHAAVEELHLLDGELWIDERKLLPGAYNRAEAPTGDQRVFSETGCTCVLITSTEDILR